MAYVKDLESLIGALQHGVLDSTQGWAQLEGLRDEQAAKRQERKAALAEMLSGVQQTGYDTAMDGGDLSTLLANPAIAPARAKFGEDALMQVLSPYFNTQSTLAPEGATSPFPYAPNPSYGTSSLNPQLPAEEQAGLIKDIVNAAKAGTSLATVKARLHAQARTGFGDAYSALAPEIDKLIETVYSKNEMM